MIVVVCYGTQICRFSRLCFSKYLEKTLLMICVKNDFYFFGIQSKLVFLPRLQRMRANFFFVQNFPILHVFTKSFVNYFLWQRNNLPLTVNRILCGTIILQSQMHFYTKVLAKDRFEKNNNNG